MDKIARKVRYITSITKVSCIFEKFMKNENDLRVIKTRANIINAFIALMKEKPLDEINVKELCDRALCSRNTFYAHFPYKEAVLDTLTGDCIRGIVEGTRAQVERVEDLDEDIIARYNRNFIQAVVESRDKINFLLQYGKPCDFSMRLTEAVYDGFLESTLKLVPNITADTRYSAYCRYLAGGTVNYIVHWMKHPEITEEEAYAILCGIHSAPSRITLGYLREYAQGQPARNN